jgi:GNAT superfamily N-acetyltransferase
MGANVSYDALRLYASSLAGVMHRANEAPGFIALHNGIPRALLTYSHRGDELEVVTLHAATPGLGIGSRLLEAVRERACDLRCGSMWLITTNKNEPAIRFTRDLACASLRFTAAQSPNRSSSSRKSHRRSRRPSNRG